MKEEKANRNEICALAAACTLDDYQKIKEQTGITYKLYTVVKERS